MRAYAPYISFLFQFIAIFMVNIYFDFSTSILLRISPSQAVPLCRFQILCFIKTKELVEKSKCERWYCWHNHKC